MFSNKSKYLSKYLSTLSIVPHFSQTNFNKRTKSMPFSLRRIADNALCFLIWARITRFRDNETSQLELESCFRARSLEKQNVIMISSRYNYRLFISRLETDSFVFFSSRFTDSTSLSKSQFLSALVGP